ncbi:Pyruvate kinase [uncultured archaeon]|nr:Pyruvate kinase [uncultured archaeon]
MTKRRIRMVLTVPPLAKFKSLADSYIVESVRLNTTQRLKETPLEILTHVRSEADLKPVWIDLKARQLRVDDYNVKFLRDKELHYITLSHKISVTKPAEVYTDNAHYRGQIIDLLNDNVLVVEGSVERKIGIPLPLQGQIGIRPGMSVNITDPSLVIQGYLTNKDKEYIEAGKSLGMNNFMLSFVEKESDITDLLSIDPKARIIAKIESKKGLEFIDTVYPKYKNRIDLMAARGDLYTEVDQPDHVIAACKKIIKSNPRAVMASRMLESLSNIDEIPRCAELFDVYCGILMGYNRFMIGDDVARGKESAKAAIGLFKAISENYN